MKTRRPVAVLIIAGSILGLVAGVALGQTASPPGNKPFPDFLQQFVYGAVVLERGVAFVADEAGKLGEAPILVGAMIKTGSIIGTNDREFADVRLGCGSRLRLAPNCRLKIMAYGIELQEGACRIRHTNTYFPMKILGKGTLLLSREGAADVEDRDGKILAQVQAGKLRALGMKEAIEPGQVVEASGRQAALTDKRPSMEKWESGVFPGTEGPEPTDELAAAFDEIVTPDDEPPASPEPAPEPAPVPDNIREPAPPPDVHPQPGAQTGEGGVVDPEDYMKNPIPVDGGGN